MGVVFMNTRNQTVRMDVQVRGDIGRKQTAGRGKSIFWTIPEDFALQGVRVRIEAKAHANPIWLGLGGAAIAGAAGFCLATECVTLTEDPPLPIAGEPPGRP